MALRAPGWAPKAARRKGQTQTGVKQSLMELIRDRGSKRRAVESAATHLESAKLLQTAGEYASVVAALGRKRFWEQALSLLHRARGRSVADLSTLNATITACKRGNEWSQALLVFRLIHEDAFSPNTHSFNSLLSAIAAEGRWLQALELLESMHRHHGVPITLFSFNAGVAACAASSQWQLAMDLFDRGRQAGGPDTVSYGAAIHACTKAAEWEHSLQLLAGLVSTGSTDTLAAHSSMISALADSEQWERALELFDTIPRAGLDVVIYGASLGACERGMQWQLALRMLEDMEVQGLEPDENCFWLAVRARRRALRLYLDDGDDSDE